MVQFASYVSRSLCNPRLIFLVLMTPLFVSLIERASERLIEQPSDQTTERQNELAG